MNGTGSRPPEPERDAERLLADLDRAGRLQRSVLAEAGELPPDPGEERLVASVRGSPPRARRRVLPLVLTMALAGSVLLWLGGRWIRERSAYRPTHGPERVDEVLGGSLVLVAPLGKTPSFGIFRWEAAERASWYVVVVLDLTGAEVDRSRELEENLWQVPQERWEAWPRTIRWEVRPFDAAGRPGRSASAQAWLSR